jgi:hypothetical protein
MATVTGNVACGGQNIQPVHQRTRSLPLTEETAIDFCLSPPVFAKFDSSSFESSASSKLNNNSMESIIEDYQNVDNSNNAFTRINGSNSILKQLSKVASVKNAPSPSLLRKKRQHHNFMTRSTYLLSQITRNLQTDRMIITKSSSNNFTNWKLFLNRNPKLNN